MASGTRSRRDGSKRGHVRTVRHRGHRRLRVPFSQSPYDVCENHSHYQRPHSSINLGYVCDGMATADKHAQHRQGRVRGGNRHLWPRERWVRHLGLASSLLAYP